MSDDTDQLSYSNIWARPALPQKMTLNYQTKHFPVDTIPEFYINHHPSPRQTKIGNRKKFNKITDLEHNFPNFVSGKQSQIIPSDPVSCFELFFDIEIVKFLQSMFITYSRRGGHHNFDFPINNGKRYIAISLWLGYLDIPWWKRPILKHTILVLRRNRLEIMKMYTHCADNNKLTANDTFGKGRPLFDL